MTGCVDGGQVGQGHRVQQARPDRRFRVRAEFRASAKDTANVSTNGGWLYYEVTR